MVAVVEVHVHTLPMRMDSVVEIEPSGVAVQVDACMADKHDCTNCSSMPDTCWLHLKVQLD